MDASDDRPVEPSLGDALERNRGRARSLATLYATAAAAAIAGIAFTPTVLNVTAARIAALVAAGLFLAAVGLSAHATILIRRPEGKTTTDRESAQARAISGVRTYTKASLVAAWLGMVALIVTIVWNQFGPMTTTPARVLLTNNEFRNLQVSCPSLPNPMEARIPDKTSLRTSDWLELHIRRSDCDQRDSSAARHIILVPIGAVMAVISD